MRRTFFQELYNAMKTNTDIFALTGDLGFGGFDKIQEDFPTRFVNCGASEVAMVGIAIGLAFEGKIPFVYSITPFLLYRPFEMLRTYVNHEQIPVKLIGSGRNTDYVHDGYSHDATDAKKILDTLPNITQYWPTDKQYIPKIVEETILNGKPTFISLQKEVSK